MAHTGPETRPDTGNPRGGTREPPRGEFREEAWPVTGNDLVIETEHLTKTFGHRVAVDDLALRVHRGEVYGFLGPNGAGKTTTLRMLVGLARPTTGRAVVLGAEPGSPESISRIGALIEAPGFYPGLSGRDNLLLLARHARVKPQRVDAVVAEVGLRDRAKDRFGIYSQGRKQRLGVAAALLKDPELLILDEPTNGLDPAGIAEMRAFMRDLGHRGRTVLLSSHLMAEVEQVCDRVGIISAGRLVREGTVDELQGEVALRVSARPSDAARRLLEDLPQVRAVAVRDGGLQVMTDLAEAPTINRALVTARIAVSELRPERASLEDVFLKVTGITEGENT